MSVDTPTPKTPETASTPEARDFIAEAVANHRRRQSQPGAPRAPKVYRTTAPATGSVAPTTAGPALLIFGVLYPGFVILLEAATGFCAKELFDPMPTWWHKALLLTVPLGNFALWLSLNGSLTISTRQQSIVNGFATGIAAFYALLFLPLLPLALVAIVIGLGLLPLAPIASFIASLHFTNRLNATTPRVHRPGYAAGLAGALLSLMAVEIPSAVTRYGLKLAASADAKERAHGVDLLRSWGSHAMLLDLANGRITRPGGPIAILTAMSEQGPFQRPAPLIGMQQAREIYYRVTGKSYTHAAQSNFAALAAAQPQRIWDHDLGGAQVGGVVSGLSLATTRLDGTINADDAVAYIEWLFEVRNTGLANSEARMSIALPPGAVVSRVTLWVNGVEEEAAFAGRAQVRAAYERVVRRSQDPFLVTTNGADRILAQAFPVPPNGVMKFKIGITAPLELDSLDKARLVMPAIVDRNFDVGVDVRHAVWLESKRALTTSRDGLMSSPFDNGATRITGDIADRALSEARPVVSISRDPTRVRSIAHNPETGGATQEIVAAPHHRPPALMIVVDGSSATKPHVRPILAALDALPADMPVGLVIASERNPIIPAAPWAGDHRARIRDALLSESYIGGADNTEALITAMLTAGGSDARVLWLHGPQPVRFSATKARFDQVSERIKSAPALSLYALTPGPNMMLNDAPWSGVAHDIPATGDITADLKRAIRRITGQDNPHVIRRALLPSPHLESEPALPITTPPTATASSHLVRLAAYDEIQTLLRKSKPEHRAAAAELAGLHRLVTPVSGAVVLESKRQYQEAGLVQGVKGQAGNVPTVPEPHEWALILLAALGLGWLLLGQKRSVIARAA